MALAAVDARRPERRARARARLGVGRAGRAVVRAPARPAYAYVVWFALAFAEKNGNSKSHARVAVAAVHGDAGPTSACGMSGRRP